MWKLCPRLGRSGLTHPCLHSFNLGKKLVHYSHQHCYVTCWLKLGHDLGRGRFLLYFQFPLFFVVVNPPNSDSELVERLYSVTFVTFWVLQYLQLSEPRLEDCPEIRVWWTTWLMDWVYSSVLRTDMSEAVWPNLNTTRAASPVRDLLGNSPRFPANEAFKLVLPDIKWSFVFSGVVTRNTRKTMCLFETKSTGQP